MKYPTISAALAALLTGTATLFAMTPAQADDATFNNKTPLTLDTGAASDATQVAQAAAPPSSYDPMAGFFANWFARVDAIQAAQPHWMTPVSTVTPRLEEEFRYDQYFETLGKNKGTLDNFDGGKGLELIPFSPVEVIIGMPPYIEKAVPQKNGTTATISGFNDWPFMLIKYRLLSANEQNGNYILTVFLQGSAPTGIAALTSNSHMITPTIAGGIGWGPLDIQMTLGESFPTEHTTTGKVVSWNTTLQAHVWDVIWPAVEFNYMRFYGGERGGLEQAFITPEVIFGRFHIVDRVRLIVGAGYQFAVMPSPTVTIPALTPMYKNNFILTTRFAF